MSHTTYPSFYHVVHVAWNRAAVRAHPEGHPLCSGWSGGTYNPDGHACYPFAGDLRVSLHAAGIRLSNDGAGAGRPIAGEPRGVEISGVLYHGEEGASIDRDACLDAFLGFVEANGWGFAGTTSAVDEEGNHAG